MQKKLIALAIAAAFSAPAFADNANVTLYGKVFMDLESVSNDKQAQQRLTRVQTNASRFGLKGGEDLGDGLKAFYQYEVQMDADGNAGNGLGNGTRNTGVGVQGDIGTVTLGNWDTPYKLSRNTIELFDNATVFSALNLMGRAGGAAGSNFNSRKSNVLAYSTPNMGGVQVNVAYSPDEGQTTTTNKTYLSMSGTFNMEGIYAAVAYESRPDQVASVTDSAMRVVGKFSMGDFWVGATVESIKKNTSATVNYTQKNMELAGQYKMGPSTIGLSYVKAGKTDVADTGASQVSLRYGYNYSKRTEVFAAYTSLSNSTAATYGFSAGTTHGTNAGSKQTAIGLGMIHSF